MTLFTDREMAFMKAKNTEKILATLRKEARALSVLGSWDSLFTNNIRRAYALGLLMFEIKPDFVNEDVGVRMRERYNDFFGPLSLWDDFFEGGFIHPDPNNAWHPDDSDYASSLAAVREALGG